jgi:hypothetical protein
MDEGLAEPAARAEGALREFAALTDGVPMDPSESASSLGAAQPHSVQSARLAVRQLWQSLGARRLSFFSPA